MGSATKDALKRRNSERLFKTAREIIPGGVNSPVRAFKAVGGNPLFVSRAAGSRIYDVDGNVYTDYLCSWGALIAGHAHPGVLKAARGALARGSSYGLSTRAEVQLAGRVTEAFPSVEMVRFVNSGTEATMSALRLARAATGRKLLVKFAGGYHGHGDSFLSMAGSGLATLGIPQCSGVPAALARMTLSLPYNDVAKFEKTMRALGKQVAAVIVEPVAGNMGVVPGTKAFLLSLRRECSRHGSLLVFDEVITGLRLCYGGAQTLHGIAPDLTCLGKIVGGGFPVGAYGGRKELMRTLAPEGPVYQAGTLSGNPVAMAAGLATLELLRKRDCYARLEEKSASLETAVLESAQSRGLDVRVNRAASMFTVFFTGRPVRNYGNAQQADTASYSRFFSKLLDCGVLFPPSQFEACFLSLAHSRGDVSATVDAVDAAFGKVANGARNMGAWRGGVKRNVKQGGRKVGVLPGAASR